VIEVYMQELASSIEGDTTDVRSVYTQMQEDARDRMERLRQQREQFRNEHNLSTLQTAHSDAGIDYREAAKRRAQLEAALAQAQASFESFKQQQKQGNLTPSPQEVAQLEQMQVIQQKTQILSQLREQLEVQKQQYGENHRTVQQTQQQIDAKEAEKKRLMDELLRKRRSSQLAQARQRVESLKQQLSATQKNLQRAGTRLTDLGNQINRYRAIEQELETARQQQEQATKALQNLQRQQQGGGMPMEVSSPPDSPTMTSPQLAVIVPGVTVLVLGLTAGVVFLRELLDQRLRSPADVALVQDAEILGVVPDTEEDPSGQRAIERVVQKYPTGLMAECFRQLRTAILSKMDRRGYKTLMVVGAQPECGASSIAQNLATSLAHNGRRVLILDCNFRQPHQHELAGVTNERGLVDVLREQATLEQCITMADDTGVALLPAGHASDAQPELLEGQAFRSTISRLEADYDFVIIDTPPALLTSEARMLVKHADAVAAVVRADRDKRGMADRMLRQLDGQRADILGVVLNGVRSSAGGYFRKSYEAFYRYGSSNGSNGHTGRRGQREPDRRGTPAGKA
jgi:capsular exopolysaccharide synthesis family protein